jgi:hypothetical protein
MQVQANPDHNARNKMYADGALKIAREAREGLRYPKFQGMFDERVEGSLERGRVGIAQGVRKAQVDSASANRMKSIETTFDGMANISDPIERGLERDKIYTEIQAIVDGGLWSASQGAEFRIQIDNRIAKQEMLSEAQTFADSVRDLPPAAQIAAVQAMPPGELRAKADALVHHQIDVDASLKRAAHETSTDSLYFSVESGAWPDKDKTPVTPESVLEKAEAAGLGMQETTALLDRIPTVTREAMDAEVKARSKELREHYESLSVVNPAAFYAMDLYERPPVMDEFGKQEIDENNQPVFRPSIASMLKGPDRDALKALQKAGPADKRVAQGKRVIEARDEYLMAINEDWVKRETALWRGLNSEQRAERSQAITFFEDAVAHKMESEGRQWLYPKELREISRKLLTPAVLDTGAGAFNFEEKVLPWELTPQYLDEQMGTLEDIDTYSLEAAAAEVEQMPEAVAADIRQRLIGAGILPDNEDVEFLRGMLQVRRHDLDEISQGITR